MVRLFVGLVVVGVLAVAATACLTDDADGSGLGQGLDAADGGDSAVGDGGVDSASLDSGDSGDACSEPDFTCCSGDVEAVPVCRAGGLDCPSGFTSAPFGGCAGDVGRDEVDGGDVGDGGSCGEDFEHPVGDVAFQTVTFEIRNTSEAARYVLAIGSFCTEYAISPDGETFEALPIRFGFDCGCECPYPGVGAEQYVRLGAGESTTATWTARRLITYGYPFDCAQDGWPSLGCINRSGGYLVSAEPGDYRVAIPVENDETLPNGCLTTEDSAFCDFSGGEPGGAGPVATLCPNTRVVTASFTLPASGDVTVPIDIID